MSALERQLAHRAAALSGDAWFSLSRSEDITIPSGWEIAFVREQEELALNGDLLSWDEHEERELRFPFMGWTLNKQYIYGLKYAWDICGNFFEWKEAFGMYK